jgi:hypothetical protein
MIREPIIGLDNEVHFAPGRRSYTVRFVGAFRGGVSWVRIAAALGQVDYWVARYFAGLSLGSSEGNRRAGALRGPSREPRALREASRARP